MNVSKLRFKDNDGKDFPKWEDSILAEICEFKNGKAHESIISEAGNYIVINSKFISSDGTVFKKASSSLAPIEKDSIVMVMSDVPNGKALAKCFYITKDNLYTLNQRICSLKSKFHNNKFIYYLINRNPYYLSFDSGVGQTNLKKDEILGCPISLPNSVIEQTKIANFLTAIDEKISQLTQKCDLLAQYKKGAMQQIFSQKLRFKDDDGREFPDWKVKMLGDISKFLDGRRKPIKESDRLKMKGHYPYYGASGIIDYVNDYIFDEEIILLGEDGENILSRNLPLAFKVSGRCWINNHAHVIKPDNSTNIDFLTQYLDSISYVKYNTGTAQPKLNQEVCKTIPLNLPSLLEQTKIANFLTAVDNKITHTQAQLAAIKQYKQGLLQQMFV